jgi:hypothetical protein
MGWRDVGPFAAGLARPPQMRESRGVRDTLGFELPYHRNQRLTALTQDLLVHLVPTGGRGPFCLTVDGKQEVTGAREERKRERARGKGGLELAGSAVDQTHQGVVTDPQQRSLRTLLAKELTRDAH